MTQAMPESLEDALVDVDIEIAAASGAVAAAKARLDELVRERRGIVLAVRRRAGRPTTIADSECWEWERLTRLDAVLRVLYQSNDPLSPSQISARLGGFGREGDEPNYVAAALCDLRRKGTAVSVGRGRWLARVEVSQSHQTGDTK